MTAASGSGGRVPRLRRPIGIPLGRVGGIPIILAPSWLVAVVIIVVLATPVVRQAIPGTGTIDGILVSAALAVLLGVSVLAHELGHCLAARSFGVPVSAVRLYLIGGVSELGRAPVSPKEEALIAGAGPAVSALLAVICGLLVGSTDARTVGWLLLLQLALANGVIAIFNILPALPLDGGRVLRAGVWKIAGGRRIGTMAAVIGGYLVAAALLVWAVVELSHGDRASVLMAGIAAVTAAFVAGGALAEWPNQGRARVAGRRHHRVPGQAARPTAWRDPHRHRAVDRRRPRGDPHRPRRICLGPARSGIGDRTGPAVAGGPGSVGGRAGGAGRGHPARRRSGPTRL